MRDTDRGLLPDRCRIPQSFSCEDVDRTERRRSGSATRPVRESTPVRQRAPTTLHEMEDRVKSLGEKIYPIYTTSITPYTIFFFCTAFSLTVDEYERTCITLSSLKLDVQLIHTWAARQLNLACASMAPDASYATSASGPGVRLPTPSKSGTPTRPASARAKLPSHESSKYKKDHRNEVSAHQLIVYYLDRTSDTDMTCPICHHRFVRSRVTDHIVDYHLPMETGDPDNLMYKCDWCPGWKAKNKQTCREHMRMHEGLVRPNIIH